MIVLDVNILVAAFRADHAHHARVLPWLSATIASGEKIGVPDLVWVGFIRICTNHRLLPVPSEIDETLAYVRAFVAQSSYVHLGGLSTLDPLLDTVVASGAAGNLTTDAYIAAVALSLAASVATLDRDFRRFDGLRIIEPPA